MTDETKSKKEMFLKKLNTHIENAEPVSGETWDEFCGLLERSKQLPEFSQAEIYQLSLIYCSEWPTEVYHPNDLRGFYEAGFFKAIEQMKKKMGEL